MIMLSYLASQKEETKFGFKQPLRFRITHTSEFPNLKHSDLVLPATTFHSLWCSSCQPGINWLQLHGSLWLISQQWQHRISFNDKWEQNLDGELQWPSEGKKVYLLNSAKLSFKLFVLAISVNKQMLLLFSLSLCLMAPARSEVILRSGHGGMTLLECQQWHTLSLNHPPTYVSLGIHSFWMTQIFIYNPSALFYFILFDRSMFFIHFAGAH